MLNSSEKRRVRNIISFRRDCARRGHLDLGHEWRLELARHSLVPAECRSAKDRFMIRFAQRQLRNMAR